ncbi:MAG: hypothetical protein U0169_10455 [Polyangiaceae bacterium]
MVHASADVSLAVDPNVDADPATLGELSRGLLDAAFASSGLLAVRVVRGDGPVLSLGAFDRASRVARDLPAELASLPSFGRGSGGMPVRIDVDAVWVGLALSSTTAFTDATAATIVNRHVRPLLRALAKENVPASYGGRDFVACVKTPVAWVGFQHDGSSRRAAFEALVAVRSPFTVPGRSSWAGKVPGTLDAAARRPVEPARLRAAIVEAYLDSFGAKRVELAMEIPPHSHTDRTKADPPFTATVEEAIGLVGAGPTRDGYVGVGGEFAASRNALAELNYRLTQIDTQDAAIVDDAVANAFGHSDVVIDGVRSLGSLRDAILAVPR